MDRKFSITEFRKKLRQRARREQTTPHAPIAQFSHAPCAAKPVPTTSSSRTCAEHSEGIQSGKSFTHILALFCVWLTVFSGSIVFAEPAPVDALAMGLFILLPAIGLVRFTSGHTTLLCVMLVLSATGLFATSLATDLLGSLKHTLITIYLCASAVVFAGFVSYNPRAHVKLMLNAYLLTAIIAALCGIAGIFSLFPGAEELFTKFDRARGTFKDPNVFGSFLLPALVYALHLVLNGRSRWIIPNALAMLILSAAILLSLSRGAWIGAVIAVVIYIYFYFVFAQRDLERLKVVILATMGVIGALGLVVLVINTDNIGDLFSDRAVLVQVYDEGPEGRFGGQLKAIDLILSNPFGIGALEFTAAEHHHENAHNTLLTIFLSNGWIGGFTFLILAVVTVFFGARHILKTSQDRPLFIVLYASVVTTLLASLLIDIDHWRHFFLLLGMLWGMMAVAPTTQRPSAARAKSNINGRRPTNDMTQFHLQPVDYPKLRKRRGRIVGRIKQPTKIHNSGQKIRRLEQRKLPHRGARIVQNRH